MKVEKTFEGRNNAKKGDWAQIFQVVLKPSQRAPQLPDDTAKVPLTCLVKGFLTDDADLGDMVTITTAIGRTISGKLVAINPSYNHSFGAPLPGFMRIGSEVRRILKDVS